MNVETVIAIRMIFSVVGVGTKGQVVDVAPDKAAELVSANAAVFLDPPLVAPIYAEDLEPTPDEPTGGKPSSAEPASEQAKSEEMPSGKGSRARESRPRSSAGTLDASGGASGSADNAGNAKPGEGDITG